MGLFGGEGDLIAHLGIDTSEFEAGLRAIVVTAAEIGGLLGVAIGGGEVFLDAIKGSAELETALGAIRTAAGEAAPSMETLRANVEALSTQAGAGIYTQGTVADALRGIAAEGYTAADAMSVTHAALDLAAASGANAGTMTEAFTHALKTWNLAAADSASVSDTLTSVWQHTGVSQEKLLGLMSEMGPVASNLGLSFSDSAALAGVLAEKGIDSGTAILKAMENAAKGTDAAGKLLKQFGVTALDANGAMKPIPDTLSLLIERMSAAGLSSEAISQRLMEAFGPRVGASIVALSANLGKVREVQDALRNDAGATQAALDAMGDTPAFKIAHLHKALDDLKLRIGTALLPAVMDLTDAFTALFSGDASGFVARVGSALGRLSDLITTWAAGVDWTALTDRLIGALALGVAKLTTLLDSVDWSAATTRLLVALGHVVADLGEMLGRVDWLAFAGALGRALNAVVQALFAYLQTVDWGEVGVALGRALLIAAEALLTFLAQVDWLAVLVGLVNVLADLGHLLSSMIVTVVAALVVALAAAIASGFASAGGAMSAAWESVKAGTLAKWNEIKAAVVGAVAQVVAAIVAPIGQAVAVVSSAWNAISTVTSAVWNTIRVLVAGAFLAIVALFTGNSALLTQTWNAMGARLEQIWGPLWERVTSTGRAAWSTITSDTQAATAAIVGAVQPLPGRVAAFFNDMRTRAVAAVLAMWNDAKNAFTAGIAAVVAYMQALPGKILAALGNTATMLYGAGQAIIQGLIGGIENMAGAAANAARNAVQNAISGAKSILGIASPSKVFHDIGRNVVLGFNEGIASLRPSALAIPAPTMPSVRPSGAAPLIGSLIVYANDKAGGNAAADAIARRLRRLGVT